MVRRSASLAAPQGFEPRYAAPEAAVLPLNEGATSSILMVLRPCWLALCGCRTRKANSFMIRVILARGQTTVPPGSSVTKHGLKTPGGFRWNAESRPRSVSHRERGADVRGHQPLRSGPLGQSALEADGRQAGSAELGPRGFKLIGSARDSGAGQK